jgi:hypothetical protein
MQASKWLNAAVEHDIEPFIATVGDLRLTRAACGHPAGKFRETIP